MYGGGAINSRLIVDRSWNFSVPNPSEATVKRANALCDVYLLAGRLRIPELEEDVLEQLKSYLSAAPKAITPRLVDYIYDKTSEISPLRKLFVTSLARSFRLSSGAPTRDFQHLFRRYPEFAVALVDEAFGRKI